MLLVYLLIESVFYLGFLSIFIICMAFIGLGHIITFISVCFLFLSMLLPFYRMKILYFIIAFIYCSFSSILITSDFTISFLLGLLFNYFCSFGVGNIL